MENMSGHEGGHNRSDGVGVLRPWGVMGLHLSQDKACSKALTLLSRSMHPEQGYRNWPAWSIDLAQMGEDDVSQWIRCHSNAVILTDEASWQSIRTHSLWREEPAALDACAVIFIGPGGGLSARTGPFLKLDWPLRWRDVMAWCEVWWQSKTFSSAPLDPPLWVKGASAKQQNIWEAVRAAWPSVWSKQDLILQCVGEGPWESASHPIEHAQWQDQVWRRIMAHAGAINVKASSNVKEASFVDAKTRMGNDESRWRIEVTKNQVWLTFGATT